MLFAVSIESDHFGAEGQSRAFSNILTSVLGDRLENGKMNGVFGHMQRVVVGVFIQARGVKPLDPLNDVGRCKFFVGHSLFFPFIINRQVP